MVEKFAINSHEFISISSLKVCVPLHMAREGLLCHKQWELLSIKTSKLYFEPIYSVFKFYKRCRYILAILTAVFKCSKFQMIEITYIITSQHSESDPVYGELVNLFS